MSIPLTLEKLKTLFSFFKTTTSNNTYLRESRLPRATTTSQGAVEIGDNLTITETQHALSTGEQAYTSSKISVPIATSNTLGVVKTGTAATTHIEVSNDGTISAHDMIGATSSTNGRSGVVPQPNSSDRYSFLCADGTWKPAVGHFVGEIVTMVGYDQGNVYRQIPDPDHPGRTIPELIPYLPEGCVPCDGQVYTRDAYPNVYDDYLLTYKLKWVTFELYDEQVANYGQCAAWGLDTASTSFKVPTIKDGSFLQQETRCDEFGKNYNSSLPNLTGYFVANAEYHGIADGHLFTQENFGRAEGWTGNFADRDKFTFDASNYCSVYDPNNTSTVQPDSTTVTYFVCLAGGSVNTSQAVWDQYAGTLVNKANKSLDNVPDNSVLLRHLADNIKTMFLPKWSSKVDIVSSVTSANGYTATKNGWIYITMYADTNASVPETGLYINDMLISTTQGNDFTKNSFTALINVGDVIKTKYTNGGTPSDRVSNALFVETMIG